MPWRLPSVAVRYYKERGRTLGDRFAAEIRTTIRRIVATPNRWRVLEDDGQGRLNQGE